uniref:Uncharacterized protein n=1 Tax=Glossina brevipalpis TaxID=37001 RepID=A0A1A9WT01_9MUSC
MSVLCSFCLTFLVAVIDCIYKYLIIMVGRSMHINKRRLAFLIARKNCTAMTTFILLFATASRSKKYTIWPGSWVAKKLRVPQHYYDDDDDDDDYDGYERWLNGVLSKVTDDHDDDDDDVDYVHEHDEQRLQLLHDELKLPLHVRPFIFADVDAEDEDGDEELLLLLIDVVLDLLAGIVIRINAYGLI